MKNTCRIHRPGMMWKIESENGLCEYIHPDMQEFLDELMKKYDITYNDIETIISTELIEDYDLKLNYIKTDTDFCCFYEWNNTEFYMLERFCKFFDLFNNPKDLYFNVIPLKLIC